MARIWTDEEIGFIREHAADMRCSDLLEMVNAEFGKSYELHQLYNLKSRLGIRNLNVGTYRKGAHASPNTEFKKGHKTWNKGISYQAGGQVPGGAVQERTYASQPQAGRIGTHLSWEDPDQDSRAE